jgi:hypothetical protein
MKIWFPWNFPKMQQLNCIKTEIWRQHGRGMATNQLLCKTCLLRTRDTEQVRKTSLGLRLLRHSNSFDFRTISQFKNTTGSNNTHSNPNTWNFKPRVRDSPPSNWKGTFRTVMGKPLQKNEKNKLQNTTKTNIKLWLLTYPLCSLVRLWNAQHSGEHSKEARRVQHFLVGSSYISAWNWISLWFWSDRETLNNSERNGDSVRHVYIRSIRKQFPSLLATFAATPSNHENSVS